MKTHTLARVFWYCTRDWSGTRFSSCCYKGVSGYGEASIYVIYVEIFDFFFLSFWLCGNFESETVGRMGFTVFKVFGNWKLKTAGVWAIVSSPSFSFFFFFFF